MKHPSIWLAALLLGGAPLCAMAFDYGPSAPLLAADAGTRQLPLAPADDMTANDTVRSDVADAGSAGTDDPAAPVEPDATPDPHHDAPSAGPLKPAAAHDAAPAASRKGHAGPGAHPESSATTGTSWQSLLPGSIQ